MPADLTKPKDAILVEAIERAGGASTLADRLGISRVAVGKWRRVPAARVREVARITRIAAARLRPDLYGAAPPLSPTPSRT